MANKNETEPHQDNSVSCFFLVKFYVWNLDGTVLGLCYFLKRMKSGVSWLESLRLIYACVGVYGLNEAFSFCKGDHCNCNACLN